MKFHWRHRGIKYLLAAVGTLVILGLTFAFVAVKMLSNDDYKTLAIWGVEQLADCRMVVGGDFKIEWSWTPSFTATDIRFESLSAGAPPPLKAAGRIHVRAALAPLLRGILRIKDLEVEDLHLARIPDAPAEDGGPPLQWLLGILTPVVERVNLQNVHVDFNNENQDQANALILQRLTLDDIDNEGALFIQGGGRLNADDFRISGRMGGTLEKYEEGLPFPIELAFTIADLQATLTGSVDHPVEGQGFNLKLAVEEQELANLFKIFRQDVPPLGRFGFEAAIAGDIKALQITDLDLEISNGTSIQIAAEGAIPDLATGRGTEVKFNQDIENNNLLTWLFPDDWKVVQKFHLDAALRYVDGDYTIEKINARIANDKGLVFKSNGSLKLGNPFKESPVAAVDLNLHLFSPDTAGIRPLLTDAIPEIGGIEASTRLVGPIDNLALEDFLIERGGSGPVQVTTHGRIGRIPLEGDAPLEDMDFAVGIQAENSKLLREFYEIPMGELGTVDLTGHIVGSSRHFKLQDVILRTKTAQGLETHVSGGIDFMQGKDGRVIGDVDFNLHFKSPTLGIAEPLLGLQVLRPLGPIDGRTVITGTTEELSFVDILATGGHPDRLYADWRGRVKSVPLTAGSVSSGHETHGTLYAARSSDFAALFDIKLPDIGPVRGSWRDTDNDGVLGMADIEVVIGDGQRFNLQANGEITNIIDQKKYQSAEQEEIEYAGVDFQFDLKTTDTHGIAKLIGVAMPDLGAVTGSWRLTGDERKLAIHDLSLKSTSATGLETMTTGDVPQIDITPAAGIREVDIRIQARALDARALPGLETVGLPDLGALRVSARLESNENQLNFEALQIRTGPENQPTLSIDGMLREINDPQRIKLEATFETGAQPWLETKFNRTITANPAVDGILELRRDEDHLQIDRFQLNAPEWGGLDVEGAGTIALAGESRVDLQIRSEIYDPAVWGTLMGMPLPALAPTRVTGWYRETGDQQKFTGDIRLGDSRFQTIFHGVFREDKPVIEATLAAQNLRLQDLGFYPENHAASPKGQKEDAAPLFTETPLPLAALNDFNLDLKILADRIEAREDVFKNVDLDLSVQNGRLQIGPTTVEYKNGTSVIDAFVDTSQSPPSLSLNLVVEDADLEEILTSVDKPLVLGGQLSLFVDLHSAGHTAREFAANLQGKTAFVIEDGRIQRKIELLATDALDFLFTGPTSGTYTDLDCTAFRVFFEDGVGTIQVFFVETPGMRAEAFGQIDLTDETLALVVNPVSKRRLIRSSSPVRIKGPLQDPSIVKVPAEEAAILAGQILVPVVALPARALGILWSVISRDKSKGDCFIPPKDTSDPPDAP